MHYESNPSRGNTLLASVKNETCCRLHREILPTVQTYLIAYNLTNLRTYPKTKDKARGGAERTSVAGCSMRNALVYTISREEQTAVRSNKVICIPQRCDRCLSPFSSAAARAFSSEVTCATRSSAARFASSEAAVKRFNLFLRFLAFCYCNSNSQP